MKVIRTQKEIKSKATRLSEMHYHGVANHYDSFDSLRDLFIEFADWLIGKKGKK